MPSPTPSQAPPAASAERPAVPPAARSRAPGWRDPRLWVGVAIVAACVVAGSRLLAAADDTVAVWSAAADLGPGQEVGAEDLAAVRVRFADEDDLAGYLRADEPVPDDVRLTRGVGAGELLPRAVLGRAEEAGTVQLPISVEPDRVPPSVAAGSVVDVHVIAPAAGGRPALGGPGPALAEVTVVDAPGAAVGLSATGRRQLVVAVDEADAARYFELLGSVESPVVTVVRRG